MGIMSSEWRGRLQHWMRTLKDDFYRPLGEISWEAFRTMEHLSQEEAMNGPLSSWLWLESPNFKETLLL